MVKGLLIRQVFMAVDLSLALLVAFAIYMVSAKILDTSAIANPQTGETAVASTPFEVKRVQERGVYDSIVTSGMFGPAGQVGKPAGEVAGPAKEVTAPPTLKLYGTAASTPEDPLATAVIENAAAKTLVKVATYYLGQSVTDELSLIEVLPRKVILLNKAKNERQVLAMADTFMASPQVPAAPGLRDNPMRAAAAANHPTIKRQEVAQELSSTSYQDLMAQLNPRFQTDDKGNVLGITSDSMSSMPLLAKAGLQDGDTVESVNGMKIRSDQDLVEVFNKFSSEKTIRLGIVRGGTPRLLSVGLE